MNDTKPSAYIVAERRAGHWMIGHENPTFLTYEEAAAQAARWRDVEPYMPADTVGVFAVVKIEEEA